MSQEVNLIVFILAGLLLKKKAMFLKFTIPKYNSFFLVHICFLKMILRTIIFLVTARALNDIHISCAETDKQRYADVNVTENHNQTS